jgi:hypothetical protein
MDRGGRKKTLHTWQATLAFRTIPAALKLRDPDAAMRYARERAPEHILTAEKLNTTAYREAASRTLEATGELMPGMDRVPEQEGFSIRFGRKEDGPSDYA